jgi:hypothetical protein
MRRRRLLLVIVILIVAIGAGFGLYVTSPSWLPRGTTLDISPSEGVAESGSNIAFTAKVKSGSTEVAGGTITWSATGGSLDKTMGSTVIFTAPSVTSNQSVTITASFGGIGVYQSTSATVHLTVSPVGSAEANVALHDLYTMTFEKAEMTNVKFTGPIVMNGTSVTMVTSDTADIDGFNLTRFGLVAFDMDAKGLILYITYLKAYSPTLNGAIEITGNEKVNIGPTPSAIFDNATVYAVRMEAASAHLTDVTLVGENIGGSEPYVPSILKSPSVQMSKTFYIYGPVTYGALKKKAMNVTIGELGTQQFSLEQPIAYSLNRPLKDYSSTNRWLLQASSATLTKLKTYVIYFHVTAMGYNIIATGDDNVYDVIPGGYNTGDSFTSGDTAVHIVYLSADELSLDDLALSIE